MCRETNSAKCAGKVVSPQADTMPPAMVVLICISIRFHNFFSSVRTCAKALGDLQGQPCVGISLIARLCEVTSWWQCPDKPVIWKDRGRSNALQ